MDRVFFRVAVFSSLLGLAVAACGGGGGSASPSTGSSNGGSSSSTGGGISGTASPSPSPSASANGTPVAGTVSLIPNDGFGPVTILGETFSYDSTGTPLAGATVVIGPIAINGATPPPTLPIGDVATRTSTTGSFAASLSVAQVGSISGQDYSNVALPTFVIPVNNITNFVPPAVGYFVEVFGNGTDGLSPGVPIPLHAFLPASTSLVLRVTSATSDEASALALINSDRASNAGLPPLTFDEAAEEVARLHARDEATNGYACHYDQHNVGPVSRYLDIGGIGLTGETIGGSAGTATALSAFQQVESSVLAEKTQTPPGGHYVNLIDSSHTLAGVAAVLSTVPNAYDVDFELVSPPTVIDSQVGATYPTEFCSSNIIDNES